MHDWYFNKVCGNERQLFMNSNKQTFIQTRLVLSTKLKANSISWILITIYSTMEIWKAGLRPVEPTQLNPVHPGQLWPLITAFWYN